MITETRDPLLDRLNAPSKRDTPPRLGQRLRASDEWLRASASGSIEVRAENLITQDELIHQARTRAAMDYTSLSYATTDAVQELRLPASIPGLVDVIPAERPWANLFDETTSISSSVKGVPMGAAAGHAGAGWDRTPKQLVRWPVLSTMPRAALDDSMLLDRYLNRLQEKTFWRSLEGDILNGDGSTTSMRVQLTGLLNDPEKLSHARGGSENNTDALAVGVALVQDAGFGYETPLTVAASPTTLRKIFTEKDTTENYVRVRDALPAVSRFIPTASLADGTALVADLFEAIALYIHGGLSISMTENWFDGTVNYIDAGLVAVQLTSFVWSWPRNPTAACVVTAIA